MEYQVRNAEILDLAKIEEIYSHARSFMAENGNPNQWGTTNPPSSQLKKDIAQKKLYVVSENGCIHGVFYFAVETDPTYDVIEDGNWHANDCYGVIHRIAGDGSGGILATAIAFARSRCSYLRIDTHHDNTVMQNALAKYSFSRCGIIYIADGTPRIAYDRHF